MSVLARCGARHMTNHLGNVNNMPAKMKATVHARTEIMITIPTEDALGLVEQLSHNDPVSGTPVDVFRKELCKALDMMGFDHQGCP